MLLERRNAVARALACEGATVHFAGHVGRVGAGGEGDLCA